MLIDYLAHQPIDDYQSVKYDFPGEDVMFLKVKDYDETLHGKVLILNPDGVWYLKKQ